jgi:hypothetical protein
MADITLVTGNQITDDLAKKLNAQHEQQVNEDEVLEGTVVDDVPPSSGTSTTKSTQSEEADLRSRINSGEWDNLDDLPAFRARTPEGQLMARTESLDCRIHQLEARLPMLLNQHLHDAYIQVLKKIHALRKTKGALFYFAYKNEGQRDLGNGI